MAAAVGCSSGGGVGGAFQHHAQRAACASRAKYREGRRPRAVKVYTVNLESRYLLIQGVPALGVMKELVEQFALYGTIEEYNPLDDYPAEEFTEVYLIKFQKIQSARVAKRKLDERSFFGSLLHVCYAPEFESVQETREKLQDRRKYIAKATSNKVYQVENTGLNPTLSQVDPLNQWSIQKQLLVKKQASNASFQKNPHLDISGSYTSEASTSNQNPHTYVHDPCQSSCYELSVRSVAAPSRGHCNSALVGPQHVPVCAETTEYFTQSSTMTQGLQEQIHNISACSNMQRKPPCDNGLGRFMPRTTQLQERKRRRDEDNKLALLGRITDSEEIIIGPRLPETPKIDLEDDSLNTSANLIRNRLKEVTDPVQTPKLSEEIPINSQTKPAMKQRRRI